MGFDFSTVQRLFVFLHCKAKAKLQTLQYPHQIFLIFFLFILIMHVLNYFDWNAFD